VSPVIVDTGFLVSLFELSDLRRHSASGYLRDHRHPLVTVGAVIVEACFFLRPAIKADLLAWIRRGAVSLVEVPVGAYPQLELTLRKYADQEIDFADAALVWLANETGVRRILTADQRDFEIFRLKGGKRFELIEWF